MSDFKGIGGLTKDIKITSEDAEKLKSEFIEWDGEFYPKSVFEWKNPDDLYKLCINQQIENNRLRSVNRTQRNRIDVQKQKIKQLSNILNELEKWLKDDDNYYIQYDTIYKFDYIVIDDLLNKLQDLKESDENESKKQ